MCRPRPTRPTRLALTVVAGILLLAVVSCRPGGDSPESELEQLRQHLPRLPDANVLVISFDALRWDALGVNGSPLEISPHLDAFAEESLVFDNAYTVAPVTPTSFAAAFTGLLPTRVFHGWKLVYDDTIASRFAAAGYRTAAFINNVQVTSERDFDTGFEVYEIYKGADEQVLENSLAWLRERRDDKIFAWIHFLTPHAPYDYREMASHLYDPSYQGPFEKTTRSRFETDDPQEIARIKSLYDGEVFYGDDLFGQLIEGLRELGLFDNTIIAVTSDHGEEFGEHGGFQHDRLTEEHVRIPLLLYHPSVRKPARSKVLVSNVDFFPTFLSLAGLDIGKPLDGRDLTRIQRPPEWVVGVSMTNGKKRWLSLRKGSHKLIQTCIPERGRTLYDLSADPGELRDLHQQLPEVTRELHRELEVVLGGPPCTVMQAAVRGVSPTVGLSAENVDALEALGYLGD